MLIRIDEVNYNGYIAITETDCIPRKGEYICIDKGERFKVVFVEHRVNTGSDNPTSALVMTKRVTR